MNIPSHISCSKSDSENGSGSGDVDEENDLGFQKPFSIDEVPGSNMHLQETRLP